MAWYATPYDARVSLYQRCVKGLCPNCVPKCGGKRRNREEMRRKSAENWLKAAKSAALGCFVELIVERTRWPVTAAAIAMCAANP